MLETWLFDGWQGPLRVALMGVLSYGFLIFLLRMTGKRTLSKMNAFDFIITVASGSTFAAVLLNDQITFVEGATAFSMLVFMQYGVAWTSARSSRAEKIVKSVPTVLVWRGEMRRDTMRKARVTEAEVLAACRGAGVGSLQDVDALVLETAGEFSVLQNHTPEPHDPSSTLRTASWKAGENR